MTFEWAKAFHIIFMVCWFACLFYLPRLFVNFVLADNDTVRQQMITMQRKLLRFSISFPILTIGFGVWLISIIPGYVAAGWFIIKMLLVILLLIYHGICASMVRNFSRGGSHLGHGFYRVFNEIPVLILFGSVILVEVKPF